VVRADVPCALLDVRQEISTFEVSVLDAVIWSFVAADHITPMSVNGYS
jgi:hypothetical protein